MLRTLFYYLTFIPWTFFIVLLALLVSLRGENSVHRLGIFWGHSCLWLAGVRIQIKGSENLPRNGSAVYIVNHQSNFDIPSLYAGLPLQFRWMAKKELFAIPLFGLALKGCGYIPIDRSDRRKAMHSMNAAAQRIKAGSSVVIFPEGTRSMDGRLQEFKKGGFLIALKAQVPVVPVAITGSFQVLSRDNWRINPGPIDIEIFAPLETSGLKSADLDHLIDEVRKPIAQKIEGVYYQ